MSARVRMLGLDGMTVGLFERLVDAGLLPNGRRLLESSETSVLLSTVPSYTIPGWASTFTGTLPGQHGLLWWRRSDPDIPWRSGVPSGFARLDDAFEPTVWRLLSDSKARVTVIDVPATFPAPAVNGFFVSGWLAPWPHPRAVFPEERSREISRWRAIGGTPSEGSGRTVDVASRVRDLTEATSDRLETFRSACRSSDDLVAMVLVGPDRISHWAWDLFVPSVKQRETRDGAAVARHWTLVDEFLGELVEAREQGETVLISSDHGSAPAPARRFHTRTWLLREGFLKRSGSGKLASGGAAKALRPLRNFAKPMVGRLHRAKSGRSFGIEPGDVADLTIGDREAAFFVHPSSQKRRDLVAGLLDRLSQAVDDDGRIVFEQVEPAAHFLGPSRTDTIEPDIIAVSRPDIGLTPGSALDSLTTAEPKPNRGIHRREGMILVSKEAAAGGPAAQPYGVEDVAPTILSALDFAPPAEMTGRSIGTPGERDLAASPGRVGPGHELGETPLTETEQREIEEGLRGLGYLD